MRLTSQQRKILQQLKDKFSKNEWFDAQTSGIRNADLKELAKAGYLESCKHAYGPVCYKIKER